MSLLKWFLDTTNNALVGGEGGGTFDLPAFVQGNVVPIELVLLAVNPSGGFKQPYTVVLDASYSVKVALTKPDPVTLTAKQFTVANLVFDADAGAWTGDLSMNTTDIDTLLGTTTKATCKLEIQVSTGGGVRSTELLADATVLASGIKDGVPAPVPGETFITSSQFENEAMKRIGRPGDGYTLVSDDGKKGFERRLVKDAVTGEYKVQESWIDYP